jgi:hypothetical protein
MAELNCVGFLDRRGGAASTQDKQRQQDDEPGARCPLSVVCLRA